MKEYYETPFLWFPGYITCPGHNAVRPKTQLSGNNCINSLELKDGEFFTTVSCCDRTDLQINFYSKSIFDSPIYLYKDSWPLLNVDVGQEKYPEHFLSKDAIDARTFYRLVDKFECVSWNSLFVMACPLRWNSKFSQ